MSALQKTWIKSSSRWAIHFIAIISCEWRLFVKNFKLICLRWRSWDYPLDQLSCRNERTRTRFRTWVRVQVLVRNGLGHEIFRFRRAHIWIMWSATITTILIPNGNSEKICEFPFWNDVNNFLLTLILWSKTFGFFPSKSSFLRLELPLVHS